MPDLPIVIPDTAVAPKDYTLSGTQELALKTVRALIDGSGAASAFLPTLQLLDPNGHVMWEGATSDTVAAGGSADVSWFPGLGGNSGASTTNAEWFLARRTTNQTMAPGVQDTVRWSDLNSSDPTLFSLATDNHPNDAVEVSRLGVVVLLAWIAPNNADPNYTLELIPVSPGQGVASGTTYPDVQLGIQSAPSRNPFGPQAMTFMVPDGLPFQLTTQYRNHDAVNRDLTQAQMWGFWWPTGVLNPF
jgi:hypothetical protein